jgi:hypothetical protein
VLIPSFFLMYQVLEEPEPGWSEAPLASHVEANVMLSFTLHTRIP